MRFSPIPKNLPSDWLEFQRVGKDAKDFCCKPKLFGYGLGMKTKSNPITPAQLIVKFGATSTEGRQRLSEMFTKNAKGSQQMLEKAIATGRKVGGYTAEELAKHVQDAIWRSKEVLTVEPDFTPWKP